MILFTILIEEMLMIINSIVVVVVVVNVFLKRDIYTPARPYLKRSFVHTVTQLVRVRGNGQKKVVVSSNKQ